jgi:hypothetical protein
VDNLIDDIRELYNKNKTSSLDMSCDLVDEKLARRSTAQQRELAKNVARASKQFEEMYKKRSFYEKMIERSRIVNAPSTVSGRRCSSHGNTCSCEEFKSESRRSLHPKKVGSAVYGRIPQVFFLISLSSKIICFILDSSSTSFKLFTQAKSPVEGTVPYCSSVVL